MADLTNQESSDLPRAALYVDGFNLYHPIEEMREPFMKWLNLWKLAENLSAKYNEQVVRVVYCTAVKRSIPDAAARHRTYINALKSQGILVTEGHYVVDPKDCKACGSDLSKDTEKQTDINLALAVIFDGIDDHYDTAYLLSADSDQAATARVFRKRVLGKKLVIVAPPDRHPSGKATNYAHDSCHLSKVDIERSLFRQYVAGKTGMIRRPQEYDPPDWFVHPDDRPRKKK